LYRPRKESIKYFLKNLTEYGLAWYKPRPVHLLACLEEFNFFEIFIVKQSNEYLILMDYEGQKRDVAYIQSNFGEDRIGHCPVNRSAPICLGTIITII